MDASGIEACSAQILRPPTVGTTIGGMSGSLTPIMQQYHRIKARHKDEIVLFRLGDFYEMFYEDAQVAARVLGIALTSRFKGDKAVPMAGVPHHSLQGYLQRLIRAGYRVAICEQLQDPREARGVVERDVIRIVTAGTLTEEGLLDEKQNNYLAAVCPSGDSVGLAWVDLSTGKFVVQDVNRSALMDELMRIAPAECLVPESVEGQENQIAGFLRMNLGATVTARPDWVFDHQTARRVVLEHFAVSSLEGFGCEHLEAAISSAGAILEYLADTQKTSLGHIRKLEPFIAGQFMLVDRATRQSLELVETIRTRSREHTLLWVLDQTLTPMGARLLRTWVLYPLRDVNAIVHRQDGVAELVGNARLCRAVREAMRQVGDLERLVARVSCGRANARDLLGIAHSLEVLPALYGALESVQAAVLNGIRHDMDRLDDVRALIEKGIAPDAPATLHDGGLIRSGFNAELDELRTVRRDGHRWMASFQAREIQRTGIDSLKVGFNKVFGYYIEVTRAHQARVPPDYLRKQTIKNAERYITPKLKEYEHKVLTAEERAKELEYELFQKVREDVARHTGRLQAVAAAIAALDALASLAHVATLRNYVRPQVDESMVLEIYDGRHPVLEQTLDGEKFVPNDVFLDDVERQILVITGPNMAGKSTFIRQVALLVVMAQMGSFVPARQAHAGAVDRLFTRVGASDELHRGQSTFMVEMNETANILNNATPRSLIVLDEVGRGTSTFDGVSLAWAVTEYIYDHIHARTLFATHYHELTELSLVIPKVRNYNVAVREWKDQVVFLRKIVEGATDKSYGIHVARLAGIPPEVVERAKLILAHLEKDHLSSDDKPSFAPPKVKAKKPGEMQLSLFGSIHQPTVDALRKLDIETMTPLEALATLQRLKEEIERREAK